MSDSPSRGLVPTGLSNKPMQPDGRYAAAADRHGVVRQLLTRQDDPPKIAVCVLIKFGQREYMTRFREEGLLYCHPLAYFRSLEADEVRRDKRDGISASYLAKDVTKIVITSPDGQTTLTPGTGLVGRVDYHLGDPEPNVYCMYAIRSDDLPFSADPRVYDFGNSGVVITDLDEFDTRLRSAVAEAGFGLRTGLVEYVDSGSFSGDLGVFRKLSEFSFQKELRFAIDPGSPEPVEIRLGPIVDISHQFEVKADSDLRVQ